MVPTVVISQQKPKKRSKRKPHTNKVDDATWKIAVHNLAVQFELKEEKIEKLKSYQNQYLNNHLINPVDFIPGFYKIDKSAVATNYPEFFGAHVHVSKMIWEGTRFYFLYYHVSTKKDKLTKQDILTGKVSKTNFIDKTSFDTLCVP
jgi:hypothetical protein